MSGGRLSARLSALFSRAAPPAGCQLCPALLCSALTRAGLSQLHQCLSLWLLSYSTSEVGAEDVTRTSSSVLLLCWLPQTEPNLCLSKILSSQPCATCVSLGSQKSKPCFCPLGSFCLPSSRHCCSHIPHPAFGQPRGSQRCFFLIFVHIPGVYLHDPFGIDGVRLVPTTLSLVYNQDSCWSFRCPVLLGSAVT